jgi:flagellar hook protein FlgE
MSFNVALTGLNAANQDLSVTANNLANVSTVGFKGSRAEFSDLFSATQSGVSSTAVGNGVAVSEVAQQFSQGDVETTGNNLDLAISGNGFFTTSNNGALQYTRDGEFQVNSAGDVVTASGANLQVYPPLATGGYNTGGLANLSLSSGETRPPRRPSPRTCRRMRPSRRTMRPPGSSPRPMPTATTTPPR